MKWPRKTVLVTGGRGYTDVEAVYVTLHLHCPPGTTIRHGGARGADMLAKEWAIEEGFSHEPFPVTHEEWKRLGPRAGPLRNQRMVDALPKPVLCIAFPGGRGTADCVSRARAAGIPVIEVQP